MRRSTRKRKAPQDFKKEQTNVRATGFRKSKQKKNEVKTIDVSTWNLKIGSQQHGHCLTERSVRVEVGRRLSPLIAETRRQQDLAKKAKSEIKTLKKQLKRRSNTLSLTTDRVQDLAKKVFVN